MDYKELVEVLKKMLPEKIPYGEFVGAEGAFAHSGPLVYEDPEPYFIEQAATAIAELLEEVEKLKAERDSARHNLRELVEADRAGRCVVLPDGGYTDKDGENALKSAMNTCYYHNNQVTRYIADAVAEKLVREEAINAEKRPVNSWFMERFMKVN